MSKQRVHPANEKINLSIKTDPDQSSSNSTESSPKIPRPIYAQFGVSPQPTLSSQVLKANLNPKSKPKVNEKKFVKLKKYLSSFFSNFGSLIILIGYLLLGSLLFQIIEQAKALSICQEKQGKWIEMKENYTVTIFNYLRFNVTFNPLIERAMLGSASEVLDEPVVYNKVIKNLLLAFRNEIIKNNYEGSSNDSECENTDLWEYWNVFLFCVSICTTVGYGQITPSTDAGQIVIMCYGLLGISLTLMTIVKISHLMAYVNIFIYKNILCIPCIIYSVSTEEDDFLEEIKEELNEEVDLSGNLVPKFTENVDSRSTDESVLEEDNQSLIEKIDEEEEGAGVPFVVTISVVMIFFFVASVIFVKLENGSGTNLKKKWNYVSAAYFMFVSSTTIGFGDLTLAVNYLNPKEKNLAIRNLVIGSFLILLSMAIIGMAFSLSAERMATNIKKLLCLKKNLNVEADINSELKNLVILHDADSMDVTDDYLEIKELKEN